jgi:hypothetical protein
MASKKEQEQNIALLEATLSKMIANEKYMHRDLLISTYKRLIAEMKAELKAKEKPAK